VRVVGLVTALTIGCAATSAAGTADRAAAPRPPAVCACTSASGDLPSSSKNAQLERLDDAMRAGGIDAAIEDATLSTCTMVEQEALAALERLEGGVIKRLAHARALRVANDGSTQVEREFFSWQAYREAVEDARDAVADAIQERLTRAVLKGSSVTQVLRVAVDEVYPEPTDGNKMFPRAAERARVVAAPALRRASQRCADVTMEPTRRRWLSFFKGYSKQPL